MYCSDVRVAKTGSAEGEKRGGFRKVCLGRRVAAIDKLGRLKKERDRKQKKDSVHMPKALCNRCGMVSKGRDVATFSPALMRKRAAEGTRLHSSKLTT